MEDWQIASLRDSDLEIEAAALYRAALPYHNFQHVLATLSAAEEIIRHCIKERLQLDPKVVYYALLFHDAGYHEDYGRLGRPTKEAHSAELARECLGRRKVATGVIDKVVTAILSTHCVAEFITAEQKAVRAADLFGLAADYATFRENTVHLKQEFEMLTQSQLTWPEWVQKASDVIRRYLSREIQLTKYFVNDGAGSSFYLAVSANLQRLQQESTTI